MRNLRTVTRRFILSSALLLSAALSFAQVKIGTNPATINSNAVLDVESATKGILFPRLPLNATTDPSPLTLHIAGMQVYNTNTGTDVDPGNYYNDGTKWIRMGGDAEKVFFYGSGAPTGGCTTGTMYVDTLEDSVTEGKTWVCSGSAWVDYAPPASTSTTPFYLSGTTTDAKGNKGSGIYRIGTLGLGVKNPKGRFHMNGFFVMTRDNYNVTGIPGGTHPIGGIYAKYDNANPGTSNMGIQNTSSANIYLSKRNAASTGPYMAFYINGTQIGAVSRPTNSSVAFNTTSDLRLKENIKPTHFGIQDVMKIEVRDYNYIADKKIANTGFIAQQLYKVFPMAVTVGGLDPKKDPWSVDYAKVTPLLVKAVQDQQAEIEKLKAQLAEKDASNMREVAAVNARLDGIQAKLTQLIAPSEKSVSVSK